jgi:hypothetical protein
VCWRALSCVLSGGARESRGDARSAVLVQRAFPEIYLCIRSLLRFCPPPLFPRTTACTKCPLRFDSLIGRDVCLADSVFSRAPCVPFSTFWSLRIAISTASSSTQHEAYCSKQGQDNAAQVSLTHLALHNMR